MCLWSNPENIWKRQVKRSLIRLEEHSLKMKTKADFMLKMHFPGNLCDEESVKAATCRGVGLDPYLGGEERRVM